MSEVQIGISSSGKLLFFIEEDGKKIARLYAEEEPPLLIAIHTEVAPEGEGRGLAKLLLQALVAYARENSFKIVPNCPYVRSQFERRPEEYADVWYKKIAA